MTVFFEKRSRIRFEVQDGAFFEIHQSLFLQPRKTQLIRFGPVLDISKSGVVLMYAGQKLKYRKSAKLSILVPGESIQFVNVHFRPVCDIKLHELPNQVEMRRMGARFEELIGDQKFHLLELIKHHTR